MDNIKQKITRNAFLLLVILVFVDSISRTLFIWSTPMVEGLLLIVIPALFYITEIAKNNMMDLRIVQNKLIIPCYILVVCVNLYASAKSIISGDLTIQNGKMDEPFIPLILTVFFGYNIIVLLYAKHKQ